MSTTASPRASDARTVGPSEGEAIWFNGALITVKFPGEWSDDKFSLVEVAAPKGRATGLHTDPSDETFYVLEGELRFHVDGEEQRLQPGETVSVRRGVPHAFLVTSEVARFLVLNTPGTHDRFFRAGGTPATDRDFAAAPAPDHARTVAAAQECGVELLGPPPFAADSVAQVSG
jgi:quercetin dioxygenase-like cupin family protein